MIYLLDANIFIEAKNRYYGFDFCPAFWEWLIEQNDAGKVASIDKVKEEIDKKDDELTKWANERDDKFFLKADEKRKLAFKEVSNWVAKHGYTPGGLNIFLGDKVADAWLIAHALAHKYTVVSHENTKRTHSEIKIPVVCEGLKVPYMNPFEMLRKENAKFVLGSKE